MREKRRRFVNFCNGQSATISREVSPEKRKRAGFTLIELLVVIRDNRHSGGNSIPRVQSGS
jgi:hypothetical protein